MKYIEMKNNTKFITALLLLSVTSVLSHGIWLENSVSGKVGEEARVHLYFGEIRHQLIEKGLKWYGGEMFADFVALVKAPGQSTATTITLEESEESLSGVFLPKEVGIYQLVAYNE